MRLKVVSADLDCRKLITPDPARDISTFLRKCPTLIKDVPHVKRQEIEALLNILNTDDLHPSQIPLRVYRLPWQKP